MQFEFTLEEMNKIVMILAKQPFETVAGLIEKISRQATAQSNTSSSEFDKDAE